ncbi:MAG: hypothetical protein P0111_08115 [Nitrospira sp.]|nr:hypothetical protein [Nitrospira sp.]
MEDQPSPGTISRRVMGRPSLGLFQHLDDPFGEMFVGLGMARDGLGNFRDGVVIQIVPPAVAKPIYSHQLHAVGYDLRASLELWSENGHCPFDASPGVEIIGRKVLDLLFNAFFFVHVSPGKRNLYPSQPFANNPSIWPLKSYHR